MCNLGKNICKILYKLFEGIEMTVVKENVCSYKTVRDYNNIFIMIDQNSLQNILEKFFNHNKKSSKTSFLKTGKEKCNI
jgi:hypothetical protein